MIHIGNRRECFFDDYLLDTEKTTAPFLLHEPVRRIYDGAPLHKGMTGNEYLDYSNVVAEKHFFKFETAVPWLLEALA